MTRQAALLQMHFATVLFGLSAIFASFIQADSFTITVGRAIFAIAVMSALCIKLHKAPWQISLNTFYSLFITGILLGSHWVTFLLAIKIGNIAVATLGFACFPAFVALFEMVFFKDKITLAEYGLIACISIGLILITPSFDFANSATIGLLWGIVSGLVYAATVVVNRYNLSKTSGVQACWWQCLVVLVILLPFTAHNLPSVSYQDWAWIACLGLLCTGLAYYLFINSLTVISGRTAAIIIALEPVYAIAIAWWLLSEKPGMKTIIGGLIIIISVVWVGLQKQAKAPNIQG